MSAPGPIGRGSGGASSGPVCRSPWRRPRGVLISLSGPIPHRSDRTWDKLTAPSNRAIRTSVAWRDLVERHVTAWDVDARRR